MNFIHRSVSICWLSVASKPALRHRARKSSPRLLRRPSKLAKDHAQIKVSDLLDHAGREQSTR